MRFKLCRKISYRKNYVRYLGTKIDENSSWKFHVHDLTSKLNKLNIANAVLSKPRHFATCEIWRSVYFAIFHPLVSYVCIVWRLTRYLQHKVPIFQKKSTKHNEFCTIKSTYHTTPRLLFVLSYNSVRFGRKSIINSTTHPCYHLQYKLNEHNFLYSIHSKALNYYFWNFLFLLITAK